MTQPPSEQAVPASGQQQRIPARGLRSLPRNVWVLTLVSFLTDVSSEMVVNLVPLFLASVLGVRTDIIGLIEGVADRVLRSSMRRGNLRPNGSILSSSFRCLSGD